MRRRDMLVGSTALAAITLASTSRAQNTIVGDIILPLTRERLLSILSDPGRFSLAVDTLRLTLMLSHPATEMANVNFDEVNADCRSRDSQPPGSSTPSVRPARGGGQASCDKACGSWHCSGGSASSRDDR